MVQYTTERALWKELGLSRSDLGLPPLTSREVDKRLQIINLIYQERDRDLKLQEAKMRNPTTPGPRPPARR